MSLILDALRKSEAERRRGEAPSLYTNLPTPGTRRRPSALRYLPWVVVAVLVAVALFAFRKDEAPATKAELTQQSDTDDGRAVDSGPDGAATGDQFLRLRDMGGIAVASPRQVAEHCPTILFSLPSTDALAVAVGGENGVAKAPGTETIVIECSTLPLDVKRAALDVLTKSGKTMLDCPVSGTGAQAARKDLVIFGSGDADAFKRSLPVMAGMSRAQRYLGAFGHAMMLSEDMTEHVHAHPQEMLEGTTITEGGGPDLVFHALFPKPGNYRIWLQFQRNNVLATIPFTVRVLRSGETAVAQ